MQVARQSFPAGSRYTATLAGRHRGHVDVAVSGRTMTVLYLRADPPGRGTGTLLLAHIVAEARRAGVSAVALVDNSDQFGLPDNVYLCAGFRYLEHGYPDMRLGLQ
jgi:GNAT superfamily N-acetyltransferase